MCLPLPVLLDNDNPIEKCYKYYHNYCVLSYCTF